VLGICNGFQILCEAHLLPGALIRNTGLKFICEDVPLRIEESVCQWLDIEPGTLVHVPINHNEGNFICDEPTLAALRENRQIVLRYAQPDGSVDPEGAPNGALDAIAGICNEAGNVFGLMPHPERAVDPVSGRVDGQAFFTAIAERLAEVGS
jgi:phosphoribosylformylglycinamidine synthase